MEPFYFGPFSAPLFGCYHAPQGRVRRNRGVVLCYPIGRDYMRRHRAFRQLAVRLSRSGFPVLRFDFHGCGDSSGEWEEEAGVRQWLTDISTAVNELRTKSGLAEVCLAGFRLGGALAAMAGAERGDISSVVLWDPVVNGANYRLTLQDRVNVKRPFFQQGIQYLLTGKLTTYTLGFDLTDRLSGDLENIDLLSDGPAPGRNVLLIQGNPGAEQQQLKEHLQSRQVRLEHTYIPDRDDALVPPQVMKSVVSWIQGVQA